MPAPARQRRILNDAHLRPCALGLTQATNIQMVTVQQKTGPLGTRPGLQWKRELSVRQERCGPNWQRNTQAVGRSQIRCTHTTFTNITELSLFREILKMKFCLVFLLPSFNSPRRYVLNKIQFSYKHGEKSSLHKCSNIDSCFNFDYLRYCSVVMKNHAESYSHWSFSSSSSWSFLSIHFLKWLTSDYVCISTPEM